MRPLDGVRVLDMTRVLAGVCLPSSFRVMRLGEAVSRSVADALSSRCSRTALRSWGTSGK